MRIGTIAAALTAMLVLGVSPASGAQSSAATETLHGTWYESTEQVSDATCAQTTDVTGGFSITLKSDGSANVSSHLLIHGTLHAAFGGNALGVRATWTRTADGYVLSMPIATITVEGDQVRFVIPDRYPDCAPSIGYVVGTVR